MCKKNIDDYFLTFIYFKISPAPKADVTRTPNPNQIIMSESSTGTCFVVMGFGKKTDFETNRVLDLDKSYRNMIKPAVEAAGLKCIRADEIVHSGLIDVPMYEQLLQADIVIADLSTSNKNAFYELGIRHALRPFSTIIIAEDGIKTFPFDINHVAVRQYHHLGEDIGFDEVMRFRGMLTDTIKQIMAKEPEQKGDSPVYTFLKNLTPPAIAAKVQAAIHDAEAGTGRAMKPAAPQSPAPAAPENSGAMPTHSILMEQADKAQKGGDWITAKTLLGTIRQMAKDAAQKLKAQATVETPMEAQEDPYLIQRLALATYKSKSPNELDSLIEAQHLLKLLNPDTSNDIETLGLWGAVHKRLWQIDQQPQYLDEAIKAYERGFYIANDYYNGINFAYLLNVRASQSADPDEATADAVTAGRVRKKVLDICSQWLKNNPMPDTGQVSEKAMEEHLKRWYWVVATMGEAYVGLGKEAEAAPMLNEAYSRAPEAFMKGSTEEQLGKLRKLIGKS